VSWRQRTHTLRPPSTKRGKVVNSQKEKDTFSFCISVSVDLFHSRNALPSRQRPITLGAPLAPPPGPARGSHSETPCLLLYPGREKGSEKDAPRQQGLRETIPQSDTQDPTNGLAAAVSSPFCCLSPAYSIRGAYCGSRDTPNRRNRRPLFVAPPSSPPGRPFFRVSENAGERADIDRPEGM
jgi:hypothetical protein